MATNVVGGGMNPENGFPTLFVEVSTELGRYEKQESAVQTIAACYPPTDYPRVLDICTGPGHFAGHLAQAGYDVTGIELSHA